MIKRLQFLEISSEPDLFKRMVFFSLGLHLALFLFFGLKAVLFPSPSLTLDAAIKVDIVALPDKLQKLPEPQAPQMAKVPALSKTQKTVAIKSTANKVIEKIKKQERAEREKKLLDNLKNEVAQEEAKEQRQAKLAKLLKGNAVSSGSALHGLAKSEFNEYLSSLQAHVHEHWNLPEWLQNDNLKASVTVFIDFRGVVLKRTLVNSSGDSRFDGFALKAVDEASPFPQPPPRFVDIVKADGITLKFP